MDKGRVKGTIDEVVGSAKRHIGHMTGDTSMEVKGSVQQIKGKVENAVGKLKDSVRDAEADSEASQVSSSAALPEHREVVVVIDRRTI
jgi:uncharacterized protein YjbJ (UPF0337 family)